MSGRRRIEQRLPRPIRTFVGHLRGSDVSLFAGALAFYAIVSVIPLTILMMWLVSLVLGDQRLQQLAAEVGRAAPKNLGADQALQRVAQLGSRLGVVAVITAVWPATAYGAGLERAFDRLGPKGDQKLEGLRGRGLFFMILLPILVVGSLVGSFAGGALLGDGALSRTLGVAAGLVVGFMVAAAALVLIYRVFPPKRLSWSQIGKATLVTATGVSVLSALFALYVSIGANFQEHYATSGLAGLVLLALWLFLSNALLLVGYRIALRT